MTPNLSSNRKQGVFKTLLDFKIDSTLLRQIMTMEKSLGYQNISRLNPSEYWKRDILSKNYLAI